MHFLETYWWMLPPAALLGTIVVLAILSVPLQANRRGQGFTAWFLLQFAALNPIYPMILLALLPNRARSKLRESFAAELDEKLKGATAYRPTRTTGDLERSLGDLPTVDGAHRSIGDVETQATSGL